MIVIENTWLQFRVVPNLNIQILYFDKPYLPKGADQIILENEKSDNNKELTYTQEPYIISTEPYIVLECKDPEAKIYCFFDFSIRPIKYTKSQEFTDLYNSAKVVLAYAFGSKGISKTIRLKYDNTKK